MGLQQMLDDEADRIADSAMHTFNNVLMTLAKGQQLRTAKRLLKHVRSLVERLESEVRPNGAVNDPSDSTVRSARD